MWRPSDDGEDGKPSGTGLTSKVIMAFVGSIILFFGFNVWAPMTYAWSTENFATRARATGLGIVDDLGHIGGGLIVTTGPVLPTLGARANGAFYAFLLIAAIIAQLGVATRGKQFDLVSP